MEVRKMVVDPRERILIVDHVTDHIKYPADKTDLIEACNNLSEFTEEQKRWFERNLPDGIYNSPGSVMKVFGLY